MSPVGAGARITREKSSIATFAPYMRLPRCQRCFESLVAETQEGWALSNEMMKPRTHLFGNSSMKYWSDGPSSLLWTDQHLECSWSLLGEDVVVMVQIGIAYTDFRCLTGSAIRVLSENLESAWRVQITCLRTPFFCFFSRLLLRLIQLDGVSTFCWALWSPLRCSGKRIEICCFKLKVWNIWVKNAICNWINIWLFIVEGGEDLLMR